ncbi:MAG: hypothetical protein AAFO82_06050 [Bacteroidota bacterium]
MKNIILTFLLSAAFISCEKENLDHAFESKGTIEGADFALCACCGGWVLKIDNDAKVYRLDSLPSEIEQEDLPVAIKFDSIVDRDCGGITYLNINRIELD